MHYLRLGSILIFLGLADSEDSQDIHSICSPTCNGEKINVTYSDGWYNAFLSRGVTPTMEFCILTHPSTTDGIVSLKIQKKGSYGHANLFENLFLANGKESLFLDAGANIGFHTLQAAAAGVHVISWEPSPLNFALFKSSVYTNCFQRQVLLLNAALGTPAQEGKTMELNVHSASMSTLAETSTLEKSFEFGQKFVVGIVTIDSTLHQLCIGQRITQKSTVSFLKIDVEGFEEWVLRGASELFANNIPCVEAPRHVSIEIFPDLLLAAGSTPIGPLEWLLSNGYELFVGLGQKQGGLKKIETQTRVQMSSMGCTHVFRHTYAVPAECLRDLLNFFHTIHNHIDFVAQRIIPRPPPKIDLWNNGSVFY